LDQLKIDSSDRYFVMIGTQKTTGAELWFDEFIAALRAHQVQLETNTANAELKKFYETIFSGNADELAHLGKASAQKHFVPRIILDYLNMIALSYPRKLAFDFNDSEVLVWAEINDNDELLEKALLKAEAFINSKYHNYGFDMETTIVEASDTLAVPNHYTLYKS
jgi:hypothetical protein